MDKRKSFENLLKMSLRHLYSAEKQMYNYLPAMIDHSRSYKLRNALITHYDQTEQHIKRLVEVFKILQIEIEECVELFEKATSITFKEKNRGMEGLILEAIDFRQHFARTGASDFSLAAVGQLFEQYEISFYTQAILLAKHLKYPAIRNLLKASLAEYERINRILSKIEREELKIPSSYPSSIHILMNKPNFL